MGHIANLRKISLKKQALAKLSLLSPLEKEDGPPFAGMYLEGYSSLSTIGVGG